MKKITIIDICGADYLTNHNGVVGVYWDGQRMTRAEFREKLADELYTECYNPLANPSEEEWEQALTKFDAEPDNAVFLEANPDIIEAVNASGECTIIWVGLIYLFSPLTF